MEAKSEIRLYRITEVGERLSMSRSSLYREIEAGRLHATQIGRSIRVASDELDRYISALSVKTIKRPDQVA